MSYNMRLRSILFFLSVVALASTCLTFAQDDGGFTLKVDISLVSLDVNVADSKGIPIRHLTRDDFLIYEEGKLQELRNFTSTESPYGILLLFDRSGSTRSQWPFLIEAMDRFIRTLRPHDRIALAAFDHRTEMLMNWRARGGGAQDVVIRSLSGGTDFYGALRWAVDQLSVESGRKGVITFTDGQDQLLGRPGEISAFKSVVRTVEESGSPFYFIAVRQNTADPFGVQADARKRMEDLAKNTGGKVFYPKKLEDVVPLYEQIARQLGASYSLAYSPIKPTGDGKYRRIEVRVKDKALRVTQYREGYYAN